MAVSKGIYRVKIIDVSFDKPLVVISESDAREQGITPGGTVLVTMGDKFRSANVATSSTMISPGECLVSRSLAVELGVREGDFVGIKILGLPSSFSALKKRISGEKLTERELYMFIKDVVDGVYGEAEIAAFLLSQIYNPLSDEELSYLIRAMVETGVKVKFEEVAHDIHSIGGVPGNSKVALISVPIVASTGLLIPKTSSRAITSPAGTADTMEVLARVDLDVSEIVDIARKVKGLLLWGGKLFMAPADDIFVNIERRVAIDPVQQMVASILSKKLAMSVEKLVIDIPVGKGAKVASTSEAEKLASIFLRQAGILGVSIRVALTYGGQPIGTTVGPALEAWEALSTLIERKGSKSLVDKAILLAGLLVELGGKAPLGTGEEVARELFLSGRAYEKFKEIIAAQGGNPEIKPSDIPLGKYTYTVKSPLEGAVTHIDNTAITLIARACGAPQDKGAGVKLHVKVGYRVNKDDPLLTLYSNSESRLDSAIRLLRENPPIVVEGMLLKILP
jgi:AMP phosphorylase